MKFVERLKSYLNSDREIEPKLLNLFLHSTLIGAVISLCISQFLGITVAGSITILGGIFLLIINIIILNIFNKYKLSAIITIADALVAFLLLFFQSGGIEGGMQSWTLIILLIPFIFLKGKLSLIMYLICIPTVVGAIIISVIHPEFVHNFDSKWQAGLDVAQSMILVSVIINSIYKFNVGSYKKQHKKILDAYDEIQKVTMAKSQFLSNMSHDIRTPMNAIIGFTNIAKKEIDNKAAVEKSLEKIQMSSNYLLALINDVLDMSKIERGNLTMEKSKVNIGKLIIEVKDILEFQMQSFGVSASLNFSEVNHFFIETDLMKLKKIVMNLMSNAVKYSKESGGKIYVSLSEESDINRQNVSRYTLKVRDEGKGISPEFIDKIFDPFEREQDTTESGVIGTGLGLSITKACVECLGGTIKVSSALNKGTEFIVNFESHYFNEDTIESIRTETTVSFDGKRVLLVEDNELNREIASRILQDIGFKVESAVNGREAVDNLMRKGSNYYDLVFMDIMMPVLDGYSATKEIRSLKDKNLAKIPIIAMTANAFDEDVKKCIEVGMNAHIKKPISVEEIISKTKSILNLERNL
ncbi:response regulator [Treponema sp.]|uniref:response regulator n=1 Tax=Treponema sp. TaxID=166 RepID=UPI00298DBB6A|nr:response regulator [Treponema sp.]MCR5613020.1 response regulator [Treponema sp.]